MAYSPPVTFGAGAIINSTDLNTNQDAARKYINVDIVTADLEVNSFDHLDIQKVALYTKESENDTANGLYKYGSVSAPKCVDSPFYLALDGAVQLNSVSYAFEEGSGTPTSNSVASGLAVGGAGQRKKFVTFSYMFLNLSQGWHTIQVVVNARNEKGFVSHRMFNVEQFYIGGYSPSALANVGTTRKLSNKTF